MRIPAYNRAVGYIYLTPRQFTKVTQCCLSRIKVSPDGSVTTEDKGSREFPLMFDLKSDNTIQCLSRCQDYTSGASITYTGRENVPVKVDPKSENVTQCLPLPFNYLLTPLPCIALIYANADDGEDE